VGAGRDAGGLRGLPAVHELAAELDAPHALATAAARRAIEERRRTLLASEPARRGHAPEAGTAEAGTAEDGTADVVARARELVAELEQPSLRRVINATGVIVHTNLGRAPLPDAARAAVQRAADGYSNLELDLATGARSNRQGHVEELLRELTGAEAAMAVNNGAGAVLLAAAVLGAGKSIVVSRGQLVEIGGGFRIPEVIAQSGARLVEVGTTNRTRLSDYERALDDQTGAVMRVHPSNFRTVGFVEEVAIEELCELGVPIIDDVGSGALDVLADEPPMRRSVAAGAALVCSSGDKLLGGPQAGLLVGRREAVAAARTHPLARALRIDKLSLAALEATLGLYREPERAVREVPVLAMLNAPEDVLARRAERLAAGIGPRARIVRASAKVGGGALPLVELEGPVVALDGEPEALAGRLRAHDPPVIARIHDGCVLLDPRTLTDGELEAVIAAVG
jgi:L-seryl-tRNA(Ser) seleniumtransferase